MKDFENVIKIKMTNKLFIRIRFLGFSLTKKYYSVLKFYSQKRIEIIDFNLYTSILLSGLNPTGGKITVTQLSTMLYII